MGCVLCDPILLDIQPLFFLYLLHRKQILIIHLPSGITVKPQSVRFEYL